MIEFLKLFCMGLGAIVLVFMAIVALAWATGHLEVIREIEEEK